MKSTEITIGANTSHPLVATKPGYGTMRLTGPEVWGQPGDRSGAIQLLRKAVELGVNFFDTADFYGPGVTNELLAEALSPYQPDLIITTKVGGTRGTDKSWLPYCHPEQLRVSVENNLKQLKLEQLPVVHFGASGVSRENYEEALNAMFEMQTEGKILHLGLTNATTDQFKAATSKGIIATVENMYSYTQRTTDPASPYGFQGGEVLELCELNSIPFIPFFSLETSLSAKQDKMKTLAEELNISVAQLNIAWLLHKSEWILPIPGTTSISHLEDNMQAANVELSEQQMRFLG